MNNIGVIGGADGETVIMVSGSIAPPILWSFFGALALMAILYFCFYRRAKGKAVCLALAAVLCVAADQAVKWLVVNTMTLGQSQPLLPPLLRLTRVHNYGAAWSSFAGQKWLLLGVTGVILAAVLWVLARRIVRHPLGICACCLILSGGIGNIIDRLRLGYVVDMLHFQFWPSYPTFNVADVCIVSGAILGAIYYVLLYDKHDRRKTDGASDPANGQ